MAGRELNEHYEELRAQSLAASGRGLGLTLFLLEIERSAREAQPRTGWLLGLAVAIGILTGIGALTRYAFGWTIIPAPAVALVAASITIKLPVKRLRA